jgi:hypothetical protein
LEIICGNKTLEYQFMSLSQKKKKCHFSTIHSKKYKLKINQSTRVTTILNFRESQTTELIRVSETLLKKRKEQERKSAEKVASIIKLDVSYQL